MEPDQSPTMSRHDTQQAPSSPVRTGTHAPQIKGVYIPSEAARAAGMRPQILIAELHLKEDGQTVDLPRSRVMPTGRDASEWVSRMWGPGEGDSDSRIHGQFGTWFPCREGGSNYFPGIVSRSRLQNQAEGEVSNVDASLQFSRKEEAGRGDGETAQEGEIGRSAGVATDATVKVEEADGDN